MNNNPPELSEKDFIQDDRPKNNLPFWLWGILFTMIVALFWGGSAWFNQKLNKEVESNPFLQVTNRQFSLFLWQFPEYMRVNSKTKTGYLPGFQYMNSLAIEPGMAEQFVEAPPELLFLYHTWKRLVSSEYTVRPIQLSEFKEFLLYAPEWQPKNWPEAPSDYVKFANALLQSKSINPSNLPDVSAPKDVIQAFQGWKNFFKEGDEINKLSPTYAEVYDFLQVAPHYARNYWRNILLDTYPNYLKSLSKENTPTISVPNNELAPFFKVALYNYLKSVK